VCFLFCFFFRERAETELMPVEQSLSNLQVISKVGPALLDELDLLDGRRFDSLRHNFDEATVAPA